MRLNKITIGGRKCWFLCRGESNLIIGNKIPDELMYKKNNCSRLYMHGDRILKVCIAQSWPKDSIRKYAWRSQAEREIKSAKLLAEFGLSTPKEYFSAFSLSPFNRIESIHEMSFLNGHENLDKHISTRHNSENIVRLIAEDLVTMTNNMVCLKDFGLGNIMYHPDTHISWIDNDISNFSDKNRLTCFMMEHLIPRLLRHIDARDKEVFWNVFRERSIIYNEMMAEYHCCPK